MHTVINNVPLSDWPLHRELNSSMVSTRILRLTADEACIVPADSRHYGRPTDKWQLFIDECASVCPLSNDVDIDHVAAAIGPEGG